MNSNKKEQEPSLIFERDSDVQEVEEDFGRNQRSKSDYSKGGQRQKRYKNSYATYNNISNLRPSSTLSISKSPSKQKANGTRFDFAQSQTNSIINLNLNLDKIRNSVSTPITEPMN